MNWTAAKPFGEASAICLTSTLHLYSPCPSLPLIWSLTISHYRIGDGKSFHDQYKSQSFVKLRVYFMRHCKFTVGFINNSVPLASTNTGSDSHFKQMQNLTYRPITDRICVQWSKIDGRPIKLTHYERILFTGGFFGRFADRWNLFIFTEFTFDLALDMTIFSLVSRHKLLR